MHLELGGEETCDRCKDRTKDNTHYKCKDHSSYNRHSCKIKDMSENTACVDSLMHDDRCRRHTHTNHTADGKVGTCKKDQARNTKCQEHSRRSLLKDVQDVVICKQR